MCHNFVPLPMSRGARRNGRCSWALRTLLLFAILATSARTEQPGNAPSGPPKQIVRIAHQHLDKAPQNQLDPCSSDPAGAVLYLTEAEIRALEVPFERLGNLADHLRRFRPGKTLATVGAPSIARELGEPPTPWGGVSATRGTIHLQYDRYHTLQEGIDFYENLAAAFPNIVRMQSIGQSVEGRDLWTLRISDNPDLIEHEEERIFFCALHHAREWATHEVMLNLAEILATQYDTNPRIRNIVDNSVVWLLLAANPDGFEYSWTNNRMWRKNRRFNGGSSFGVDLNRNYDYMWGLNESGSSSYIYDETYRGPWPASEPETQAIQDFLTAQTPAIAVSYHAYSQLVLYPWGYTKTVNPEAYTSLRAIGDRYASLAEQVHGMIYTPGVGSYTIYPTNGDFTDYAYGKHGVLAYTPEVRPNSVELGGFLLPEEQILPNNEENIAAALWMMENVAAARSVRYPSSEMFSSGFNPFALPLTPVNQKPETALGMVPPATSYLNAWLDDAEHTPPYYGVYPTGFEGIGSGSGYRFEHTPESRIWPDTFDKYKSLPYVFDHGAVVMIESTMVASNHIGIPSEVPVRMVDISIYKRGIYSVGTTFGREERILEMRTALDDLHHDTPWISWDWTYTAADGAVYHSHPEGLDGADEYVHPFRSYEFTVYRRSYSFGGTGTQVQLLLFPPSLRGDADGDGDLDLDDHGAFLACMTGPISEDLPFPCKSFDADRDSDVDATDLAVFQREFGWGQ